MKGLINDEEARNKGQYKLCFDGYNNNSFNGLNSIHNIAILNEFHRL